MRTGHFLIAAVSGLLFTLAFRLNQVFDSYFVYSAGISLLFIPAGVKLLLLLLGRMPAYIGLLVSGIYLGWGIWPEKTLLPIFLFAFIGLSNYAFVAFGLMKWLNIRRNLKNLRYWHIVLLSAVASVLNGVVHNLIYITQDVTLTEEFWLKSFAMTLGDFMGCFVTVGLFHSAVQLLRPQKISVMR